MAKREGWRGWKDGGGRGAKVLAGRERWRRWSEDCLVAQVMMMRVERKGARCDRPSFRSAAPLTHGGVGGADGGADWMKFPDNGLRSAVESTMILRLGAVDCIR